MMIHALTYWYLLTSRLEHAGPLYARAVLCFFWIGVPSAAEILTLLNAQWSLAVLAALILVSKPPDSRAWKIFDVVVLLAMGLTGPYCILLLPIALAMWLARHARWTLVLSVLLLLTSVIQMSALRHWVGVCVPRQILGSNALLLLATKIFLVGALGTKAAILHAFMAKGAIPAGAVVLVGAAIVLFTLMRAPLELRLFLAFGWLVVAAAASRLRCDSGWQWEPMLTPAYAERYWYIARLGLIASLLWLALDRNIKLVKRVPSMLVLILLAYVTLASWQYPPAPDLHWPQYVKAFRHAPAGTTVSIPINPGPAFTLNLTRTPRR